jgi:hypothetical protein
MWGPGKRIFCFSGVEKENLKVILYYWIRIFVIRNSDTLILEREYLPSEYGSKPPIYRLQ